MNRLLQINCSYRKLKTSGGLAILMIMLFSLLSKADENEIHVVGIDFYPYTKANEDGTLEGVGLDLITEIAKNSGIKIVSKQGVTTPRMLMELKEPNRVSTLTARTPEREDQFNWIGELYKDKTCFINLKKMKPINTIEEAKKLNSIGVNKGGATEVFLKSQNFTNLQPMLINRKNAQKLSLGRLDAIYSGNWVGYYSIKVTGGDPHEFQCGGAIETVTYYIAASLNTSPSIIKKLTHALEQAKKNKSIEAILKKKELEPPNW